VVHRVDTVATQLVSDLVNEAVAQTVAGSNSAAGNTSDSSPTSPTTAATLASAAADASSNSSIASTSRIASNSMDSSPQAPPAAPAATASPNTSTVAPADIATDTVGPSPTHGAAGDGNLPGTNDSGTSTGTNTGSTPPPAGNAAVNQLDNGPALDAFLVRILPELDSEILDLGSSRDDSVQPRRSGIAGNDPTFAVEPLDRPDLGLRQAVGGGGVTAALLSDSVFGASSRLVLPVEGALGISSSAGFGDTGAFRSQGIDFRPLNGSGVGVVGTVLAGVEAGPEEADGLAAGDADPLPVTAKAGGSAPADDFSPPSGDTGLKQFLLGLDPAAPPAAPVGDAAAPLLPAPVPDGVGPTPALTAVPSLAPRPGAAPAETPPAALDAAWTEGFETEGVVEARPEGTGKWTGPVFLLVAPVLFLSWWPELACRKPLPGPAPAPPKL
jgi:hypothetical protein